MKKLFISIIFSVCLIMLGSCNNDEPIPELTAEYLEATTWDAELTGTQSPIPDPISAHFIMQFINQQSGKCIPAYGDDGYDGSFVYSISKEMITFNGAFVGNWSVMERTNNRMVLQAFMPLEFKLVLTKK